MWTAMPDFDLFIRGAHPLPEIGIADGRIVAFSGGSAREEIDATGWLVLPGVVDAHVHFNDPGRADWEGWATGSHAALAGGVTTVCDMPLNSTPPVVTVAAFDAKRAAAEARSACDFALWGGLVPGHLDDLEPLAARGVIAFKAFMSHSGIDDFPKADLATLRSGMLRAAALNLPVAVHAEFDRALPLGTGTSVRAYLDSRPIESECEAIGAALDLAGETGCALHVVHVSSGRGVALIAAARARGLDVTCETCPHYLVMTGEDMERLGATAKCAPPMRDAENRESLWTALRAGEIQTIGSDHSPAPWSMKTDPDFFQVWGGISGVQHLLPLLLDAGLEPELCAALIAHNPARRFRLRGKGDLAIGADADLALVDFGQPRAITAAELLYRHAHSPYVGRKMRARVRRTILRGKIASADGKVAGTVRGQLLTPA
jgi:allantoinase